MRGLSPLSPLQGSLILSYLVRIGIPKKKIKKKSENIFVERIGFIIFAESHLEVLLSITHEGGNVVSGLEVG